MSPTSRLGTPCLVNRYWEIYMWCSRGTLCARTACFGSCSIATGRRSSVRIADVALTWCRRILLGAISVALLLRGVGAAPPPDNLPPEILSFEAVLVVDDYWEFRGEIVDEDSAGCNINFGALLDGHSVSVNGDGMFSYVLRLEPDEEGLVSAQSVDAEGAESDITEDIVVQP